MRKTIPLVVSIALLAPLTHAEGKKAKVKTHNPVVVMKTNQGVIKIELDAEKAPISTQNFLKYVKKKHYDNSIFHRVIAGFMIQGGGYDSKMKERSTDAPIKNEAANGLKNVEGTIAMARTQDPDSATAQFFINVKDNAFLDKGPQSDGYAVFGKVTSGLDIVHKIEHVKTAIKDGMADVPVDAVTIESARQIN